MKKPLPIGFDNFKDVIDGFGKTLSVSMLKYFFENTGSESRNLDNRRLFAMRLFVRSKIRNMESGSLRKGIRRRCIMESHSLKNSAG